MMWNGFDIFSILLIPNVAMLPILWFYALALSRGLAFARDDQHRLVPLSPWELFWLGARRSFGRLVLYGALGPPFISPFIWVNLVWTLLDAGLPAQAVPVGPLLKSYLLEEIAGPDGLVLHLIMHLHAFTALCPVLAAMTLLAPRFKSLLSLVMTAFVLLTSLLLLYAVIIEDRWRWTAARAGELCLFGFTNVLTLALAWYRARYVLDRRWFRFLGE